MSVLFRRHRGSLTEAMSTVVEVSTIADIYNNSDLPSCGINSDDIEIKHTAKNRNGFALGALYGAEWLIDKKGWFEFKDIFF